MEILQQGRWTGFAWSMKEKAPKSWTTLIKIKSLPLGIPNSNYPRGVTPAIHTPLIKVECLPYWSRACPTPTSQSAKFRVSSVLSSKHLEMKYRKGRRLSILERCSYFPKLGHVYLFLFFFCPSELKYGLSPRLLYCCRLDSKAYDTSTSIHKFFYLW
jgi:hypothetical protein